jgi:hypothetical protein
VGLRWGRSTQARQSTPELYTGTGWVGMALMGHCLAESPSEAAGSGATACANTLSRYGRLDFPAYQWRGLVLKASPVSFCDQTTERVEIRTQV